MEAVSACCRASSTVIVVSAGGIASFARNELIGTEEGSVVDNMARVARQCSPVSGLSFVDR
jgi:hypothetical protein